MNFWPALAEGGFQVGALAKRGGYIDKTWMPYLSDVAFQAWVMEKALHNASSTFFFLGPVKYIS